jgi:uncharacterized protein YfkK (UPF0435 family)
MSDKMNVYRKLQEIRTKLSGLNLKKTGSNAFSKYTYYELSDILPTITKLCNEFKVCSIINFSHDIATLEIINIDNADEKIIFTTNTASAEVKGCQPIQSLGAVQTYLRRYLYMNAFEIVEADVLDENTGKKDKDNNSNYELKSYLSDAQIKRAYTIATTTGKSNDDVHKWIKAKFNLDSMKMLNKKQYDELCKALEQQNKGA